MKYQLILFYSVLYVEDIHKCLVQNYYHFDLATVCLVFWQIIHSSFHVNRFLRPNASESLVLSLKKSSEIQPNHSISCTLEKETSFPKSGKAGGKK